MVCKTPSSPDGKRKRPLEYISINVTTIYGVQQTTNTIMIVMANLTVLIFAGDVTEDERNVVVVCPRIFCIQTFVDETTTRIILI
jgi:hypothetical protein